MNVQGGFEPQNRGEITPFVIIIICDLILVSVARIFWVSPQIPTVQPKHRLYGGTCGLVEMYPAQSLYFVLVTKLFSHVGLKVFLNISSRHLCSQLAQPVFTRPSLK